jgi:hypothetical protein
MIAKKELNSKLALFFRVHDPASSHRAQPAKTSRAKPLEDNWMEVRTRRCPGDYLRTRSPNEPLGNY